MNNATPALFAFLLAVSLPAMAGVAAMPAGGVNSESDAVLQQQSPQQVTRTTVVPEATPVEAANTTNRLHVTGEVRSEYTAYRPGLGLALASADDELRIDHEQYTIIESEFNEATAAEQAAMIQAAYDQLKQRADELEQREQQAVRAHAAGDRSTASLVRLLIRNHNEAAVLSEYFDELATRAEQVPDGSLSSRQVRIDENVFNAHRTSLRASLSRLADSSADSSQSGIVVSTSQTGYSLSMMYGDTSVGETTRFDNRDETATDQFDDFEAFQHTMELYPWAAEHGSPHFQDNSPNHYWTEISHNQGRLEVYLDAGTGEVYREVQELTAPSLPVAHSRTQTSEGLEITVNETPANGPAKVTVTETDAGNPTGATIMLNGREIGETAPDGTLWFVPPSSEYRLTAKTANGNVSVSPAGS